MECRRVKRATSRNGAGRFGLTVLVPLLGVSGEASAMLVYSYYSDQIIITTDERRTGPVDLPPEVGPSIAACWRPPHKGDQVTVQLSFKRDGSLFGKPRINYVKPTNGSNASATSSSISRLLLKSPE